MTAIDEVNNNNDKEYIRKFIRGLIFTLPIMIIVIIAFAWWQYPEPYEFFQEFVSNLGGRISENGHTNDVSSWIMVVGFSAIALIALVIAILYFIFRNLKYWYVKAPFSLFLTFGALGIAIPKDHPTLHLVHGIGAFVFILGFAMFNFSAQLLRFRRYWPKPDKMPLGFYRDTTMTILVFAAMMIFLLFYLLERVATVPEFLAELGQKIVLIVDCIAVYFLDNEDV